MKRLVIIFTIYLLTISVSAQPAELRQTLEQANQAYTSADYNTAASLYESIVSAGYEASGLYFNMGNTFFKLNDIPSAVLYYEKALKLDPGDENTRFNLALANSRIIDKMEPLPQFFLKNWWNSANNLQTSDQWARTAIFGFVFLLIATSLFIIARTITIRKISFWSGLVFLSMIFLSIVFSLSSYRNYKLHSSAIIFTPTVTAKSSPVDNSIDLFVIHEGTKVLITDQVEGWSEVKLANGSIGWVKTNTYRPI